MKHRILFILSISILILGKSVLAQEVLPEFKLKQLSPGKVYISWHNPNKNCIKLVVQSSTDQKKFTTIITAKKPSLYENSFTDDKSPKNQITFYRIQYTLKNGYVYFSKTHSTHETANIVTVKDTSDWKASPFVFTNKNGDIQILVNNPATYVYRIKFLDVKGNEIFEIKKLDSDNLILDKTNFLHAGWFLFELYKDEQLLEKNTFFLK